MSTRTSPYINNFFLISWLLSHFVENKYFIWQWLDGGELYLIAKLTSASLSQNHEI